MNPSKYQLQKFYEKWKDKDKANLINFIRFCKPDGMFIDVDIFEKQFIDYYHTMLNAYLNDHHAVHLSDIKPKTVSRHVGIEIECFSKLTYSALQTLLIKYQLDDHIQIGRDGSIRAPTGTYAYELRILFRELRLERLMSRLTRFMTAAELDINDTCGLHVHLDMRNRDFNMCYNRLHKFQDLLFGLVKPERRTNYKYCAYVIPQNMNNRKVAINRQAYDEHRTVEIRLHEGSVDGAQILNWINLLLKIVKTKNAHTINVQNKPDVLNWSNDNKIIQKYIKDNYDENWNKNLNVQKKVIQWIEAGRPNTR